MDNTLLTIIGGLIVLFFIIVAIIIRFKTKPSAYDKESAQNFLLGLGDSIYEKMVEIVSNFDVSSYSSIEEFEVDVLGVIYDDIWDYVTECLEENSKNDILSAMAVKVLNKDYVIKFIDHIAEECDLENKISDIWFNVFKSKTEGIEDVDNTLPDDLANQKNYIENVTENDLVPAQEVVPTEEELASLNPPSDDEKDYDPENDSSVEIIEEDDTYLDSRGRKRSRTTGRYV